MEVFHHAGTLWNSLTGTRPVPRFRVTTASVDGRAVRCDGPIRIQPDVALAAIRKTDLIFIPTTGVSIEDVVERNAPVVPWLRRWHKEVGPAYPGSDEGRRAPLDRRERNDPALAGLAPVIYTPTFILVRDGREVDRLVGYPGAMYFWTELDTMLKKLRPAAEPGTRAEVNGALGCG